MAKSNTIILERCFVPQNGLVMRKDDMANCAYLIQSGSVCVYDEKDEEEIELARLGVGDIFGEMALVHDDVRTANVRALEDCNLIVITRQTFREKLDGSDPTIKAVVEMLVHRVRHLNSQVTSNLKTPEDVADCARSVFESIHSNLEDEQAVEDFEAQVQPKFDSFIQALTPFMDHK